MEQPLPLPTSLRERAVRADEGSTLGLPLAELWRELATGRSALVDHFQTGERCVLLVRRGETPPRQRLDPNLLTTFENVLLGQAQKCEAIRGGIATSTVAVRCKDVLQHLNVHVTCSKVPLPIVVLVHAHRGGCRQNVGRRSLVREGDDELTVVSFPRAELCLAELLSRGEFEVAALCVNGQSHEEIARLRGVSRRTVANQIGSVFRKLGVSGRAELMAWLAREPPAPRRHNVPDLLVLTARAPAEAHRS